MRWGNRLLVMAALLAGLLFADADRAGAAPRALRVLTHSSFSASRGLIEEFETATGAVVQFTAGGDAGETLNKAILAGSHPLADVIFGVDNTFMSRALAADILEPWKSPLLAEIPAELQLDPTHRLLPVDVGQVCLNYDKSFFERRGIAVPRTLEELTQPAWKGLLVVENPATSSPGLAFLLATIARFGEKGPFTWESWWAALRANDVLVVNGWSEAYYDEFSGAGKGIASPRGELRDQPCRGGLLCL